MATSVDIATELLAAIVAAAAASPRVEVCGLLFGSGGVIDAVQHCRNVAADPRRRFEVDPVVLLAAHRRARAGGPGVIGCFHSHPAGTAAPSARDAADARADGQLWLIAAGGEVTAWRAVADGEHHARFDPVALLVTP